MLLTKVSPLSGKENTIELDITEEQLADYQEGGECIQDAFPNLNLDEREFIMTGITAAEWESLFGEAPAEEL